MSLAIRHAWPGGSAQDAPVVATSLRSGGVSRAPYATLNMGARSGDEFEHVRENRRRFLRALGVDESRLVLPHQVHSTCVSVVCDSNAGRGLDDPDGGVHDTDALVTQTAGLSLGVLVADCVPVAIFDAVSAAAALIHAGRQGTIDGIMSETLRLMHVCFGTSSEDCLAIIGPSIGVCCYEVSEELAEAFRERYDPSVTRGRHLDLPRAIEMELGELGLPVSSVARTHLCTACRRDLFFSHRRDGYPSGRMMAVMSMPPEGPNAVR